MLAPLAVAEEHAVRVADRRHAAVSVRTLLYVARRRTQVSAIVMVTLAAQDAVRAGAAVLARLCESAYW